MQQKAVKTNRPRILERTLDPPAAVPESRPDATAPPSALQSRAGHHIAISRIVPAPPVPLQAKLEISEPGDPLEEEADRVADLVMRMPERDHAVGHEISRGAAGLQRMCGECESEEEEEEGEKDGKEPGFEKVQRKEANRDAVDSVASSQVVAVTQTGGQPLDAATRAFMEPRFGFDFSTVRIHVNGDAADAARSVNARAYTLGTHVVFNAGRYSPDTSAGQWLLAHELAHVKQQNSAMHAGQQLVNRQAASAILQRKPRAQVVVDNAGPSREPQRVAGHEPPRILELDEPEAVKDQFHALRYIDNFYASASLIHSALARGTDRAIHQFFIYATMPSSRLSEDVIFVLIDTVLAIIPGAAGVKRLLERITQRLPLAIDSNYLGTIAKYSARGGVKVGRATVAQGGVAEREAASFALDALREWDTRATEKIVLEQEAIKRDFDAIMQSPYWRGRLLTVVQKALGKPMTLEEGCLERFEREYEHKLYYTFYRERAHIETEYLEDTGTGKTTEVVDARRVVGLPDGVNERVRALLGIGNQKHYIDFLLSDWRLRSRGAVKKRTRFKDVFRRLLGIQRG